MIQTNYTRRIINKVGLETGTKTMALENVAVSDFKTITGMAKCVQAVTIDIFQGFKLPDDTLVYCVKDSFTVPADETEGAGVKIGPVNVLGDIVKVVTTMAGATTTNFHILLEAKSI